MSFSAVMGPPTTMFTEQNYDFQFGTNVVGAYHIYPSLSLPHSRRHRFVVNVIGHFHLRTHLLPALLRASAPEYKPRIVITSSSAAYIANEIKWTTLKKAEEGAEARKQVKERKKMDPMGLYYQSKFVSKRPCATAIIRTGR